MNFAVWAPHAGKVELEAAGDRYSMVRDGRGWWSRDLPAVGHGIDYGFHLDDSELLPDPRSLWQPHGVHGPSRTLDFSRFRWTDLAWQARPLPTGVIYELHVGTFTPAGTFDAAIERLDYLRDLGVTHVELMPVAEFPGDWGWGYDGVDLFAPHHAYGGPEGLQRLVNACHEKGLAAILDVVYNHLGPEGNYLPRFGPYFNDRYHTPWGSAVNFDGPGCDEVRRFVVDNVLMWLGDYHFDGVRLDAVHAYYDHSALHILEQIREAVDDLQVRSGRHLVAIAESDLNDPRIIQPREIGGCGLDAQWSDDFHHTLHSIITGERDGYYGDFGSLTHLAKAMTAVFVYDGCYSAVRDRTHGRPVRGLSGHRFLGYLQNHDQIGNRARGERVLHLAGPARTKIGSALVFTSAFVPMLFQGEEWGASTPFLFFTHLPDPQLARAVSEGRRKELSGFGWDPENVPDPQDPATFQRSKLKWDEISQEPHRSIHQWYRDLIRLRNRVPVLKDGRMENIEVRCEENKGWLIINRGPVTIAVNFAGRLQTVRLDEARPARVLLASQPETKLHPGKIELPAQTIAILGP